MEKSTYWAIFQLKEIIFEGTYSECWKELVSRYGDQKVQSLVERGIRISRKS